MPHATAGWATAPAPVALAIWIHATGVTVEAQRKSVFGKKRNSGHTPPGKARGPSIFGAALLDL